MVTPDDLRLIGIAWRLDRLRWVPSDVLHEMVLRDGTCVWTYTDGDPPQPTGGDLPDRQLTQWLCAHCPVQDECLELELRTSGEDTTGVWGALTEDERRALYPRWLERGERAELDQDPEGGQRP